MSNISKIVYVSNTRLPTEKAHGLALVKLCEAFSELGYEVDVVSPRRWRKGHTDIYNYYKVKRAFSATLLPTIDLIDSPFPQKLTFFIQIISFSLAAFLFCLIHYRGEKGVLFFSHDHIPLFFLSFLSRPIYYDVHHFPGDNFFYRRVMKSACGFSVQTKWKVDTLKERFGIHQNNIVYWPNGTDVEKFSVDVSKDYARKKLKLLQNIQMVLYTGTLYSWKGVLTLIKAAKQLPDGTLVYIVGGTEGEIRALKQEETDANSENIVFLSFQDHSRMPLWLKAADVLVLPNTGKEKVSRFYTSPMKLFEYMASGVPIVASNITSIREVVGEREVLFAESDDPVSFAEQIQYALERTEEVYSLGKNAKQAVQKFTWSNRARKITDHIGVSCR